MLTSYKVKGENHRHRASSNHTEFAERNMVSDTSNVHTKLWRVTRRSARLLRDFREKTLAECVLICSDPGLLADSCQPKVEIVVYAFSDVVN